VSVNQFQVVPVEVDISDSTTISDPFSVADFDKGAILTPDTLAGTTLNFQVSTDGIAFFALRDQDNVANFTNITIAVDLVYNLPVELFNYRTAKLVLGTAELADRTFTLFLKG